MGIESITEEVLRCLLSKLTDVAVEYAKSRLYRGIWKFRRLSKCDRKIMVEYVASLDVPMSTPDDSKLLRGILEDLNMRLVPLDLSSIKFTEIPEIIITKLKGETIDIVMANNAAWIIIGLFERLRDIFEIPQPQDTLSFDELVEICEKFEEYIREELRDKADLVYMIKYIIIPITREGLRKTHELVDRIHWMLSTKIGIKAILKTIILDYYNKKLLIPSKDVTLYNIGKSCIVAVMYDVKALKDLLLNL